jgi:hypothetical protein
MTYSASYDPSTGITGWAWSPEYGWIQFNGSTATVPSFENDAETPDWATGAINLSGSNGGTTANIHYGVAYDPTLGANTSPWAWGGNVLGWIDFSRTSITPNAPSTCAITPALSTITPPTPPTSVTLTFSGSNVTGCTASATPSDASFSGSELITTGTTSVSPTTTTTYNMSCLGSDGITNISCSPATVTVSFVCDPTVDCCDTNASNYLGNLPCLYANCNGGVLTPQQSGVNCGITNCPACTKNPHYIEN